MTGIRLHFVVEGQTEETFVNEVLTPYLAAASVWADVRCAATGRKKNRIFRGGIVSYAKLKNDLVRWINEDDSPDSWFTTMVDLYGLGRLTDRFPGYDESRLMPDPHRRVTALETAFSSDISCRRFVPYVQLHEFEALLFAEPSKLESEFMESSAGLEELIELAGSFASPELINEGEETAPSKRIIEKIPAYDGRKTSAGPNTARRIGLTTLRSKCFHFNDWLTRLETLGGR